MKLTLRKARLIAGLTQRDVVTTLGINKGTLINYEKFRTLPDIETAKALAKLYGLSIDDLIFLPNDCALSTNA